MSQRIKVGDFFQIPLADGRYAYCQHVNWNAQMGFLVQVLDRISDYALEIDELAQASPLFPPVFVGL
jgi:immunity protein 26 of polymorphic toxin system